MVLPQTLSIWYFHHAKFKILHSLMLKTDVKHTAHISTKYDKPQHRWSKLPTLIDGKSVTISWGNMGHDHNALPPAQNLREINRVPRNPRRPGGKPLKPSLLGQSKKILVDCPLLRSFLRLHPFFSFFFSKRQFFLCISHSIF